MNSGHVDFTSMEVEHVDTEYDGSNELRSLPDEDDCDEIKGT